MRTINRRLSLTTLQHYKFCGTVKNPDTVLKEKGKWPQCDGLSLMGGGGGVGTVTGLHKLVPRNASLG